MATVSDMSAARIAAATIDAELKRLEAVEEAARAVVGHPFEMTRPPQDAREVEAWMLERDRRFAALAAALSVRGNRSW